MSVLLSLVSGWTGVLGPFTLRGDGTPVNLTGLTVTLTARRDDGTEVTLAGTVTVADQTTSPGQVSYSPVASDFTWITGGVSRQPYHIRWKVVDGAGKTVYFPNGLASEFSVFKV